MQSVEIKQRRVQYLKPNPLLKKVQKKYERILNIRTVFNIKTLANIRKST